MNSPMMSHVLVASSADLIFTSAEPAAGTHDDARLAAHRHHYFASKKEIFPMTIKSSAALAALRKHTKYLQDAVHADIVEALEKEGLAIGDGGKISAVSTGRATAADLVGRGECLTVVAASAIPRNAEKVRYVLANAKRLGFDDFDPSEKIDVAALNRALADKPVAERMRFKEALFELRLIPA
jgi:hypothetical protein